MTRLVWGATGERFYEAGVDRGVLYVDQNPGVAWNGLTSVQENPNGGSPSPYYVDGYKYINVATASEFEATIEALSTPSEFGVCDGSHSLQNGLIVTHQVRKPFGFSYRTLVGNDTEEFDRGYKIHIVYNALASPSSRSYSSLNDSPQPSMLSWPITTVAPRFAGIRPTAHVIIDSRSTDPATLLEVEDILYGSDVLPARQPSLEELSLIFAPPAP